MKIVAPSLWQRLLPVALCTAALIACSTTHSPSPQPTPLSAPTHIENSVLSDSINLDEYERSDQELRSLQPEARALRLSVMWYQRATSLSSVPGPAYTASLLRSAHLALSGLLSEACDNPFNRVCGSLDAAYTQALTDLVRQLAVGGWKIPDLAPSRYRFAAPEAAALQRLQGWKITLPNSDFDPLHERPGLGLATIGCKDTMPALKSARRIHTLVCSPVTFILLFDSPSSSDSIQARLLAVDSYQQEVLSIEGQQVLIRAQIDSTLGALQRNLLGSRDDARLSCLSLPTRDTATVLVAGSSSALSSRWIDQVRAISRHRDLTSRVTPCFLSITEEQAIPRSAREALEVLREIVAPRDAATLERQPIALYLAAVGREGISISTEIARRIVKRSTERRHPHRRGAPFALRGIIVDPVATNSDDPLVNNLLSVSSSGQIPLVLKNEEPDKNEDQTVTLYGLIRSTLSSPPSDTPATSTAPLPNPGEATEPLELSPVL